MTGDTTERTVAVILAAGKSARFGGGARNKVLAPLAGEPILVHATRPFASHPSIDEVIVVAAPGDMPPCTEELRRAGMPDVAVIAGGDSRHASEWLAISSLATRIEGGEVELVVIHDAARPLYRGQRLADLLAAAREAGGAIFATPIDRGDALVRIEEGKPPAPAPSEGLWRAQTPQAFRASILLAAFRDAEREGFDGSDTSSTVERMGVEVRVIAGDPGNIKLTYQEELTLAESLMDSSEEPS